MLRKTLVAETTKTSDFGEYSPGYVSRQSQHIKFSFRKSLLETGKHFAYHSLILGCFLFMYLCPMAHFTFSTLLQLSQNMLTHTHTRARTRTHTHTRTSTRTHTHMHIHIHTQTHSHTRTRTPTHHHSPYKTHSHTHNYSHTHHARTHTHYTHVHSRSCVRISFRGLNPFSFATLDALNFVSTLAHKGVSGEEQKRKLLFWFKIGEVEKGWKWRIEETSALRES